MLIFSFFISNLQNAIITIWNIRRIGGSGIFGGMEKPPKLAIKHPSSIKELNLVSDVSQTYSRFVDKYPNINLSMRDDDLIVLAIMRERAIRNKA